MAQERHHHTLRFKKHDFEHISDQIEDRIKFIPKRIFDDVEICDDFEKDHVLSVLETFFKEIGVHVKKLMLVNFSMNAPVTSNISKFLKSFPNAVKLTFLIEIDHHRQMNQTPVAVELPKLKQLHIMDCSKSFVDKVISHININGPFLEEMRIEAERSLYDHVALLKMHQSTLKKLEINVTYSENVEMGYNKNVMEFIRNFPEQLQLESFKLISGRLSVGEAAFKEFLKKNANNLMELTIEATYFEDSLLNSIFDLENLRVLEIESFEYKSESGWGGEFDDDEDEEEKDDFDKTSISTASTDNLQKLGKLVKLKFNNFYGCNILSGLGLVVNENLLELEANFDEVNEDFMLHLPHYIPNIKKLIINRWPHEHIDSLKHFNELEFLKVSNIKEYSDGCGRRYRKLPGNGRFVLFGPDKTLHFSMLNHFEVNMENFSLSAVVAKKIVKKMSNLQYFNLTAHEMTHNAREILLDGLKHLIDPEWQPASQ
jgi:hypothetical protein